MKTTCEKILYAIAAALIISGYSFTQTPLPTPPDGPAIKIVTQEVKLNVAAQYASGRFVPNLTPDDLLVVESGDPQEITSMKKVPASVLFLLDTGGNISFVKSVGRTRVIARILVNRLDKNDNIAILQSYDKVELVSDWGRDRDEINYHLDTKLFGGDRGRFTEAVRKAVKMLKQTPLENRHLVFIGDGLDSIEDQDERHRAFEELIAANVTIHVIAYNNMEAKFGADASRAFQFGEERELRALPDYVVEQIIESIPVRMRDDFRRFMKAESFFVLRLDRKALKLARKKVRDWRKTENELKTLAEDTGGMFQSPEALDTMWLFAEKIAEAIDSQYVISYTPTEEIDGSKAHDRKIRVSTHRNGVRISARRRIVIQPAGVN